MIGRLWRYLHVTIRFVPFALAFLRDRRRFVLFGRPRRVSTAAHTRRAERMTETMLDLGAAFIKVGQVLSTRPDVVPPAYTEVFATLQDRVPEDSGGDPRAVVETDLGDELDLSTLEPIAGGSLAFVYTADFDGERIALKVRRPGLKPQIERDLQVIRGLIPLLSLVADERQQYSLRNIADDFEEIILDELDFEREASMMDEIGANFAADDRIVVPGVVPALSSARVIAMEFVPGTKITDEAALENADPTAVATLIATTYLRMGLVDGVFHADPHPGNLSLTDEGQLVIYDYGMSQRLPPAVQSDIVGLYRTLIQRDVDGLIAALVALDVLEPSVDRLAVRTVLELVIENLEGRSTITWRQIITELLTMLHDFPFRIPPDVMLLIRVGTVGEGVCRQLDPHFDFLAVTRSFLVEHGFIESEIEAFIDELRRDLRASVPVLAKAPARFDRVFGQLERGELAVRTVPVDAMGPDERVIGYAVLAGLLFVATALLTFHEQPYELVALALAIGFLFTFFARSRST